MSINDIMDSDLFFPVLALVSIIMLISMSISILKFSSKQSKENDKIYGEDDNTAPRIELNNVKIVAKRSTPHPINNTIMVNYIVFESEDGNRLELAIKDPNIYGIIVEGDIGTLTYQGKKFIDFRRS